ncbi:MAG TPA: phage holin family protein [Gaiellaceae bacterium]
MAETERRGEVTEPEADSEDAREKTASDLLEQVGRDAGILVFRELQLTAARHDEEIRRAARNLAITAAVVVAFTTAFVVLNWAIVEALKGPLPGWRAPLVLAAAWAAIGAAGAVFLATRPEGIAGIRALLASTGGDDTDLEAARDRAEEKMRASIGELSGAVASETGVLVAAAIVPMAGGAMDAGEKLLDEADEITDRLEEVGLPGGRIANQVFDVVLVPGRLFIRVTSAAFKVRR